MTTTNGTIRPRRQPVPVELGGKWIAWSADGLRIVASGDTLDECELAAERTGEKEPSFERTPHRCSNRRIPAMKFDYPEYRVEPSPAASGRDSVFRPVIPVRMTGRKASRKVWALLDTGADESYITESMAKKLGVTPLSGETTTIHSASGELRAWYGELSIEISKDNEQHSLAIVVGVVPEDWSEMILGHSGFFEFFDAAFSDCDQTVSLVARHT